ncbi:MAG TPA: hypothetical protein VHO28_07470 [Ignavibacteriales bacterium]|nr:hypothetical protein [Ignavibacteriales bacterium]
MKNLLILILFSIILYGCAVNDSLKSKIINKCAGKDSCIVKIKDFTRFEWDTMYVFNQRASKRVIKELTGIEQKERYASHKTFFKNKNQVVYFEEQKYDPSDRESFTLNYDIYNVYEGYMAFTPETANFYFVITKFDGYTYYDLAPINKPAKQLTN